MRALVTGGTRGIGAAIVTELRAKGYACFAHSRTTGHDLSKPEDRARVMEEVGQCDVLVNNVGGGGRYGDNAEVWQKNVHAMTDFTQWALSGMLQRDWGRVITIASIHGREAGASRAIFSAAKAAQIAYMKRLARTPELVRHGITFNTVCPGNVLVGGNAAIDVETLPMGRMGKPEEVAKLVAFLCSENAAWINGSSISIDGAESHSL